MNQSSWPPLARGAAFLRRNGRQIILEFGVNFAAPLVVYDLAHPRYGDVGALIASSAPPIAWSAYEFARRRRIDAISLLVIAGIVLSLLAFWGGGGVRFLQLRERLVTGAIGLVFLVSAAVGRPLIYQLARASLSRRSSGELAEFEGLKDNVYFRRTMTLMTLVWGFGLVIECAISVVLVFTMSVRDYLIFGRVLGYGFFGLLMGWTMLYARSARRRGEARRAAAIASQKEAEPSDGEAAGQGPAPGAAEAALRP